MPAAAQEHLSAVNEAATLGTRHNQGFAASLLPGGNVAATAGDPGRAYGLYVEAAHLSREHDSPYLLGMALQGTAFACLPLGRGREAEEHLGEAVRLARVLDDSVALVFRVQAMVGVAVQTGDAERTAQLIGVAGALQRQTGGRPLPLCQVWLDRGEELARRKLGEARYESLRLVGERLDRSSAMAFVLGERSQPDPSRVPAPHLGPLSPRERGVALLVAEGLGDKEIARRLFLSERTVERHVYNILNKLGFSSRVQIAGWVSAAG